MRIVIFDDVLWRRQGEYVTAGHELRFYEHADDAAEVARRERPELVCMDYSMDGHDSGEVAVRALRAVFPIGQLTIVGISSDPDSNRRMVAAGADHAVPKAQLQGYLRRLATGGRP